ncbi:MAG: NADPH-quinone reductase, partial [Rhodoferax sp.]|nr:NADPH-quinone reductase [Rhodoferax sp.]
MNQANMTPQTTPIAATVTTTTTTTKTTTTTTTAKTMKAIRLHAFGGPEVLRYEEAPLPDLKPGEVLVRVHAVGINPPDWYLRGGYAALPPEWRPQVAFPLILGTDVSGVIAAVADDVTRFAAGDAVYSMVRFPGGINGESL